MPDDFTRPIGQTRWDGRAWSPYTPPSRPAQGPRALRTALPQVFGGSVARMHAVIERYSPLAVVYSILSEPTLSLPAQAFISQTAAVIKSRIGLATEVLTQAEYDARKAAAAAAGLAELVP